MTYLSHVILYRYYTDIIQFTLLLSFLTMLFFLLLLSGGTASRDPELTLPTPGLITYWGYPAETHPITTSDGYILGLHRIPNPGAPAVFLQHGIEDSSATWVMNDPGQSLGFMLWDAGFDVWMGNVRGNVYSKKHTKMSHKDPRFWDFTFDEYALIDLPAMLEYVIAQTGVHQVSYFGHSQGTLIGFIGFSQNETLASKVNIFGALAPVARITHVEGLIKALNLIEPEIEALTKLLGISEFSLPLWLREAVILMLCPLRQHKLCENLLFLGCGWDTRNMNETRIPRYVGHAPAGTSTKNMIHWAQLLRDKQLQRYDYGSEKNMEHYNSTSPPLYDISSLSVPTALFSGGNDFLADPRDVVWLEGQLNPRIIVQNVFYDKYNHLDFVWGIEANRMVYDDLIKLVKNAQIR